MSDTPKSPAKNPEAPAPEPVAKTRKEIPLIAIQDDGDMIAEEMAEMFDEDRVSHQHGSLNQKRISIASSNHPQPSAFLSPIAGDRFCPAQTLRLDRTKPLICSAVELVPSQASPERNFKQSSPSAFGGPHLFGKCGDPRLRDSRSRSGQPATCCGSKKKETVTSRSQIRHLHKE